MKNKNKIKNMKSKFEKIMVIFISTIVIGLFSIGYAMEFYDSVIAPVFVSDSNTVNDADQIEKNISLDSNNEEETPSINNEKSTIKTKQPKIEEAEADAPSISIGSINAEHKNDPDYVTYDINLTDVYYTQEVDGKIIKKKISNITGGTISVKKDSVTQKK